jgi:carboxypeptidase family protein/TonB-dependent receptor-like protein
MRRGLPRRLVALLLLCLSGRLAAAQTGGSTAPLSGVVIDEQSAVIPGVTVVVKSNATGVSLGPVVSNRAGLFAVAALDPGTYTVTFSMSGFKTVVMKDVQVVTATPTDLKVVLTVGPLAETVPVQARSSVIQTQATAVSATLYSDQIKNLPLNTRDALNFATLLPGVDTGLNHIQRNTTSILGLPMSAISVSIDGIQTQSQLAKSMDGFWSIISPNIDAMEEVTVSMATPGADASGQGAVQIRFTTRSGTDRYAGAFFETWRHPVLYANTFFNKINGLPVNQIVLNDFGGNVGGPIVLPGLDGRGRAFFFTNFDELHQASELTRRRVLLVPSAQAGRFTYTGGGVTRQIDLLALAAANGQISARDPTIAGLLAEISTATTRSGSTTPNADGNTAAYTWSSPDDLLRRHWTSRVDVNLGPAHRVSGIYNFNKYARVPDTLTNRDPRFPGLPVYGSNTSFRNSATATLRSTLSPTLVNEATSGAFWQTNDGGPEIVPARFANQGGYSLTLAGGGSAFTSLAPATPGTTEGANQNGNRSAANPNLLWSLTDRMSWQHGRHYLQFGGELTLLKARRQDQQVVPVLSFGVVPLLDPADALFSSANFPGASTQNVADARHLYALLTGRVTSMTTEFALDPESRQYVKNGRTDRRTNQRELGLFVQDAFRVAPGLTLNLGLRYELQFPLRTGNSVYSANTIDDACGVSGKGQGRGGRPCNLFMPGTLTGRLPVYEQYVAGTARYETDLDNFAPSLGIAWLPGVKTGLWRALLGNPEVATIRAAYARAFNREGMNRFAMPYELNPGASFDAVRNVANGNLVLPGETWPLLLSEPGRLGPGTVPLPPAYPMPINRTAGVNLFDPDWEVALVDSFSAGLQRGLTRDMAIEIRYIGTRGRNLIEVEDWNEINLVENGFLNEFKLAQANLAANIAAGRGQTIAHTGPETSPLPTYLAYFTGSRNASDPSAYTGLRWSNPTILGRFAPLNPNPGASALDLHNDATLRANALAAGVPPNVFVLNPDVGSVNVHVSKGSTRYDALQVELRRRLSQGLAMTASYSVVKAWTSRLDSLRVDRVLAPSINAVPHSFKVTTSYDVPFGRGKRFGAEVSPWLETIAGGWSMNVTGKVTSGRILSFGNVRLMGMTPDELRQSIKYRMVTTDGTTRVYNLPQDIIDNTVKAFSVNVQGYTAGAPTGRYFAPANGPDCIQAIRGDCAPVDVQAVAPPYSRFDFGARKQIALGRRARLTLEVDVLNLFNAINFNPVALPNNPANRDGYLVTDSYQDVNNLADPGSRIGQVVIRFSW